MFSNGETLFSLSRLFSKTAEVFSVFEEVAANPMAVQANTGPKKETKAMKRRVFFPFSMMNNYTSLISFCERKKEERERQELAQIEEEKKNMVDHKGIEIRKIQNKLGLGWICKHVPIRFFLRLLSF